MRRLWIWVVLGACGRGPSLEATTARHVLIEIEAHEYVDSCMIPCGRFVRPNEHITRCASSEAGWALNPRFEGETSPRTEPAVFDMAKRLGPLAQGYALCSFAGDRK
jgi:hypothetical protein